ncbi:hypothetical protein AMTRI_Chr01g129520 [Amborella trichopoda]
MHIFTFKQIEAGSRAIIQYAWHDEKIWIRIFPNKPIYNKTRGNTYGLGKGIFKYWVSVIKHSQGYIPIIGGPKSICNSKFTQGNT